MFKLWLVNLPYIFALANDVRPEAESISMIQDSSLGVVKRVRVILQDMATQLAKDAEEDSNINEEMKCWCKDTVAERTKLIADNSEKSTSLRSDIELLRSKSSQLNDEINHLKAEVDANMKSLDQAIAMRDKGLKEFTSAEASSFQTIQALDGAQKTLAEKMPKAMMQSEMVLDAESPVLKALQQEVKGHHDVLWALHNKKEKKLILDIMSHERDIGFIQSGSTASRAISAPFEVIHGTIATLKKAFQDNLQKMQDDESADQAAHDATKKAKKAEIAAGLAMIDKKTGALADTDESAASAREELDDVETALNADKPYLVNVQEQCALHEKEFVARKQTREEESSAVSGALNVLASDEARDSFTKALGHTKRSEKLGSRAIEEYKEEQETESKRSQINKARKQMWGQEFLSTSFLQVASDRNPKSESRKLSEMAQRTEAYWAAQYYNKENNHAGKASTKKVNSSKVAVHKRSGTPAAMAPRRNKLGLTSEQMAVRKNQMGKAAEGVVKMIDNLVLQEGQEKARKTWCVEEIISVEKEIDNQKRKKKDHEEAIQLRTDRIAELNDEIKGLEKEQEDSDIELAKAGIDRKKACTAFQVTVADQKEAKRLLGMALQILESFYGKHKKKASLIRQKTKVLIGDRFSNALQRMARAIGTEPTLSFNHTRNQELHAPVFVQVGVSKQDEKDPDERAPPPPGFKGYATSSMQGGVVSMMTQLMEDTDAMTKEAAEDETHSMEGYEGYVANVNEQTLQRREQIVNRKMEVGKLEEFNQKEKLALSDTIELLATLRQHDIDLYGVEGCQYLLKNYESRFIERREEIDSLKEAQTILGVSGGNAAMTAATHGEDSTIGDSVELTTAEPIGTEPPEEAEEPGSSAHVVLPEGIKIEGPNGETAVSKMIGR